MVIELEFNDDAIVFKKVCMVDYIKKKFNARLTVVIINLTVGIC